MTARNVLQIEYGGDLIADQITTGPWLAVSAIIPERGWIPGKPQFHLDVLQPVNVDGARYRVGGAHFPQFRLITVVPAVSFTLASSIAREHELCKGDQVFVTSLVLDDESTYTCQAIDVRSIPSAKRVLGANAGEGAWQSTALASVDTEWMLQVIAR